METLGPMPCATSPTLIELSRSQKCFGFRASRCTKRVEGQMGLRVPTTRELHGSSLWSLTFFNEVWAPGVVVLGYIRGIISGDPFKVRA